MVYSHAAIHFKTEDEATKVLENKDLKIRDKKIYAIPAYESVLHDVPSLGKIQNEEVKAAAQLVKVSSSNLNFNIVAKQSRSYQETSGPPNKKMKLEKSSNGKAEAKAEAEEEESDDEEEEDADEDGDEEDDEEGDEEEGKHCCNLTRSILTN